MIQQLYSYVYSQKNWKQELKQVFVYAMLIAALLTKVKMWKQHKCPSADEWISKRSIYLELFILKKEGNSDTCYNMDKP